MTQTIPKLLSDVLTIGKHHRELRAATGDLFNIFSILEIERNEVTTHSRMLRELLDPKGSHGLNHTFLALFLTQLGIQDFDYKSAYVRAEYYIGPKTEKSGGRVDIAITDGKEKRVYLEMKIDADLQENQLERYAGSGGKPDIYYLTLYGYDPIDASPVKADVARRFYKTISFKNDILTWLTKCIKEASQLPILRETIIQYINVVKNITDQNPSDPMNNEIVDAVTRDSESLSAFFDLIQAYDPVINEMFKTLQAQMEVIAGTLDLKCEFDLSFSKKGSYFAFCNKQMLERNVKMGFEFDASRTRNLDFGFFYQQPAESLKTPLTLYGLFEEEFGKARKNDSWPCYVAWIERRSWGKEEYLDLLAGKLKEELKDKLERMVCVFNKSLEF